jgi:hypothetical protein
LKAKRSLSWGKNNCWRAPTGGSINLSEKGSENVSAQVPTDFMIVEQKLAKKQFFYLYISTIWILNRQPDNSLAGYLARRLSSRPVSSNASG